MKILILSLSYVEQGTYFRWFHFGRHLVKLGHKVTICAISPNLRFISHTKIIQGVRVIQTPMDFTGRLRGQFWGPADILCKICHILKNKYDVVIVSEHTPNVYLPYYLYRRLNDTRSTYIGDWADWWFDDLGFTGGITEQSKHIRFGIQYRVDKYLEIKVKKEMDGIITTSTFLRERAISHNIPKERVCYIPSGADVDNIRPLSKQKMREELGLAPEAKIVAWVGTATVVGSDVDFAIRAFCEVYKSIENILFMIIGPKASRRQKFLEQLHLVGKVIETGRVRYEELPKYLACADVFVLPLPDSLNNRARGPIKLGDYMAAGRPTVVNDIGDAGIWFKQEKIGLLAKPDMSDFAEKIVELLRNEDLCEELGRNAKKVAEEKFSWAILAKRLEDFILEIKR